MKSLLGDLVAEDNLIAQYNKVSEMIVCPTLDCVENLSEAEERAKKELI